jgi:uncharacterized protein YdaU (DUF1376 family)
MDMTLEQQGAYRNLLDEGKLRGGPLPDNEEVLAKACGDPRRWKQLRGAIMSHFTLKPDGWHNTTLDEVIRDSERRAVTQRHYRVRNGQPEAAPAARRR